MGGGLPAHPRQPFGRLPIHRVREQQPIQPLRRLARALGPLGDLGEYLEGEDVFGIQVQHSAEHCLCAAVVFFVDETAAQHDVTADIVGMDLQSVLTIVDRRIYKPRFAIRISQRREVPPLGILPVACLELLDFAGVRHALSLCGDWCKIVLGEPRCQIAPRVPLA